MGVSCGLFLMRIEEFLIDSERVWSLRFEVWGLRFQVSGFKFEVSCFRFEVSSCFCTLLNLKPETSNLKLLKTPSVIAGLTRNPVKKSVEGDCESSPQWRRTTGVSPLRGGLRGASFFLFCEKHFLLLSSFTTKKFRHFATFSAHKKFFRKPWKHRVWHDICGEKLRRIHV